MIASRLALFVVAVAIVCVAQSNPSPPQSAEPPSAKTSPAPGGDSEQPPFSQRLPRYELRAGDVFDLTFEFSPEFNQTVTVQPDGFVTLRGVGDIHVGDLAVPELTRTIKTAYASILNDPAISIVLKDFEKPYFMATGQVNRPGKYDLRGDTTVTEAIAIAGGLNESAKHSQVVVYHRVSSEWMEGRVIDVKKMQNERRLAEDLLLKPGDMVFVPQSAFSKYRRYIPAPGLGVGLTAH